MNKEVIMKDNLKFYYSPECASDAVAAYAEKGNVKEW